MAAAILTVTALAAEPLKGRWDAEVTIQSVRIPFTLHFAGGGATFSAALAVGKTRVPASEATFDGTTGPFDGRYNGGILRTQLLQQRTRRPETQAAL